MLAKSKVAIFLLMIYGLLFYRAFFSFNPSFDFLWYHLPISLSYFGKTTYLLSGFEKELMEALPPAAHWVQGGLVWLFDRPHLGNAVNSVGFILTTTCIYKLRSKTLSLEIFLLAMLGIPLFVAQLSSGFIDGWTNSWLLLSMVAFIDIAEKGSRRFNLFCFCSGVILATLSKYQTWPIICLIFPFVFFELRKQRDVRSFVLVGVTAAIVAIWPIRNFILFGNPTHPYVAPGFHRFIQSSSVSFDTNEIVNLQLYEGFKHLPRPLLFVMSAFEVTRLIPHPHQMQWTYEQWSIGETQNPNFRMGGWSFLTVIFFILAAISAYRRGQYNRVSWILIFSSLALVSALPQSYELRYYLFIPFLGAFIFAELFSILTPIVRNRLKILLVVSAILVICSRAVLPYEIHRIEDFASEKQKLFWQTPPVSNKENAVCVSESPSKVIYWAGPRFNSIWVRKCNQ